MSAPEPPADVLLVFITAGSEEEATRLAEALLSERLVACVNRLGGVHSEYWWKGTRDTAREVLMLAKTRRSLWPRVLETVRRLHSYEIFSAFAIPLAEGNPDYLRWIAAETATE
jgi:periplasmic divalent cation tolerance protein